MDIIIPQKGRGISHVCGLKIPIFTASPDDDYGSGCTYVLILGDGGIGIQKTCMQRLGKINHMFLFTDLLLLSLVLFLEFLHREG